MLVSTRKGLSRQHVLYLTKGHALAKAGNQLVIGTTTGNLNASPDENIRGYAEQ